MNPTGRVSNLPIDSPDAAIDAMVDRLRPVETESVHAIMAHGRVLAQPVVADRDNPACDVSAMDGFAVRVEDLSKSILPVSGEVRTGQPTSVMPQGVALRIFTGAPVPAGCEVIIPREHVRESTASIELPPEFKVVAHQHIRHQGENALRGQRIVEPGRLISPAVAAVLSAFGVNRPVVHRRVRLAAIVTGHEVHAVTDHVEPWQLRDSNGPALAAMFAGLPWVDWQGLHHVPDDANRMRDQIAASLGHVDALLITGGVSMGDYDFVPQVLASLECRPVFHKLPIRPGKPVLGAVGAHGQLVMGLPGNPVSMVTTARRLACPLMRHLAGYAQIQPALPRYELTAMDDKTLPLYWMRLGRVLPHGKVELIRSQGSGDIVGLAHSDGFVELRPNERGSGYLPFYRWSVEL